MSATKLHTHTKQPARLSFYSMYIYIYIYIYIYHGTTLPKVANNSLQLRDVVWSGRNLYALRKSLAPPSSGIFTPIGCSSSTVRLKGPRFRSVESTLDNSVQSPQCKNWFTWQFAGVLCLRSRAVIIPFRACLASRRRKIATPQNNRVLLCLFTPISAQRWKIGWSRITLGKDLEGKGHGLIQYSISNFTRTELCSYPVVREKQACKLYHNACANVKPKLTVNCHIIYEVESKENLKN